MITVDDEAGVRTITLQRPEAHNALTSTAFAAVNGALIEAAADDRTSAVIVTGAGREAYCAGQDLKELPDIDPLDLASHPFHAFIETLAGHPKPLIAAVRGLAVGAGVTMLPYFDFVVASTDARFQAPFVKLGVPTEGGSSAMLAATVGPRLAARMLLLGEWIGADEALACGLVTALAANDDVGPRAAEIARQLAALSLPAVTATKRLLSEARKDSANAACARERAEALALYTSPAFREVLARFDRKG